MTDTAYLTAAPAGPAVDLQHLDATLANLRRTERDVATMAAYLAEACGGLAATPDDPEAARRVTMTTLRMRAEATGLAHQFAALARLEETAP